MAEKQNTSDAGDQGETSVLGGICLDGGNQASAAPASNTEAVITIAMSLEDTKGDDDEMIARKLQVAEQLTTLYGFSFGAVEEALTAVGPDTAACCDYILKNNLAIDQGGPVVPVDDCPHININISVSDLPEQPHVTYCSHQETRGTGKLKATTDDDGVSCPSRTENWICLQCGVIRCGRYVNAHAKSHFETTGHCTSICLADLSTWCYLCEAYVVNRDNPTLTSLLGEMEKRKFPTD